MNRLLIVLTFAALSVPTMSLAANEGNPKPVTIENEESQAVPVAAQSIIEYRYAGATRAEFDGDDAGGVGGLNAACEDDFGPGARIATSTEAETRTDGLADPRDAWILPTPPVTTRPDPVREGTFRVHDALGQVVGGLGSANEDLALAVAACGRFRLDNEDEQGMAVTSDGLLKIDDCDEIQPAACSAPVAIPVR